jgi:hypothetical protein
MRSAFKCIKAGVVGILSAALVLCYSSVAVGWEIGGGGGATITIQRSVEDTADAEFTVYRQAGSPNTYQWTNGYWYTFVPSTAFFYNVSPSVVTTIPASCGLVTWNAIGSYSHLVVNKTTGEWWFIGAGHPEPVYLAKSQLDATMATSTVVRVPDTSPVSIVGTPGVSVLGTPGVSVVGTVAADVHALTLEESVSVDGTLPVTVAGVGDVDSEGLTLAVGVGAVLMGVGVGRAVWRR